MVVEGLEQPHLSEAEAFWRLYDPRRTTQHLGELITKVCEKRQTETNTRTVRGLARAVLNYHPEKNELTGAPLVWSEVAHATFARNDSFRAEFATATNEPMEHLQRVEDTVEQDTEESADRIVQFVENVANSSEDLEQLSQILGVQVDENTDKTVLAGLLLSFASHRGQFRQNRDENGKLRPYFSHPLATALLYQKAWNETVKHRQAPNEQWLYRQLFVNLLHDAFEDMIPRDPGQSFMEGRTLRATPLLLHKVLLKLGEDEHNATRMIQDIMLVTKTRGLDGESQESEDYIRQCTSSIRAMIAKFCDTSHNKIIDTKIGKDGKAKTKQEYDTMLDTIGIDIDRTMKDDFGRELLTNLYKLAGEFERDHEAFMDSVADIRLGMRHQQPVVA